MNLLFITTSNLTSNPRLRKEIEVALNAKFKVTVLLTEIKHWTKGIEEFLRSRYEGLNVVAVEVTRENFKNWFIATSLQFICSKLTPVLTNNVGLCSFASDKRSYLLLRKLININQKFDLIVAHNLGALYPSFKYAVIYNVPFIFDVEDFHPGEVIHGNAVSEKKRREHIMKTILTKAAKITAASPLIAKETGKFVGKDVTVINNSFFNYEFIKPKSLRKGKVKFVWFSQNINHGRGLELILPVLDKYKEQIELTLIGFLNENFARKWLFNRNYVTIVDSLPQEVLHQKLSEFDIGLALELRSTDLNRDLALTNKIFAYMQAGLYILATDTKAQANFMEQHVDMGCVIEQSSESVRNGVELILNKIDGIREESSNRYETAKKVAFENEKAKLLEMWREVAANTII